MDNPLELHQTASRSGSSDECRQFARLQELVCELLIKNQQLRTALTEALSASPRAVQGTFLPDETRVRAATSAQCDPP